MAIKNSFPLLFKEKQKNITDNGQFNNFTLNNHHQISSDAFPRCSKSVTERRKVLGYAPTKLSDFAKDSETKKESHSWNKSAKNLSPYIVNNVSGKENRLKKSKNLSASTLSLYIESYENPNEANLRNLKDLKKKDLIKNGLNAKQIDFDSTAVIQNAFEFSRQQENGEAVTPEIAQFRASQQILNPNLLNHQDHVQQPMPQHSAEPFMEDDDFNYGDDAFIYSQGNPMEMSFLNECQPSSSSPRKSPRKTQTSTMDKSFFSPPKKGDVSIIDISESPLFAQRPPSIAGSPISGRKRPPSINGSSPVFAKRPPSINLDDITTFSKPRELRFNIPENVPFSELDDEAFGSKQTTKPTATAIIEHEFFGVYCLISRSPHRSFKNRCYIGYTVDPNRRIRQHNSGQQHGGAKKTENRGPWDMVCIVHGFPNSVSAYRFEWAWQNPDKSRRLKEIVLKKTAKESQFAFRLRIVCHMLNSDPWRRLALTFRWLIPLEEIPFPAEILPPKHMVKKYGLVEKSTETVAKDPESYQKIQDCFICFEPIAALSQFVRCQQMKLCITHFHTRCLAESVLKQTKEFEVAIVPIEGRCLRCHSSWRWGDLIRDQQNLIQISTVAQDLHRIANAALLIPKTL